MMAKREFLVGALCEMLYRDLESVEFDIAEMFSPTVVNSLSKVAKSMSCPTIYLSNSLLGVMASCMATANVKCTKTHMEPMIIWSATLGMKGTAKVKNSFCLLLILTNHKSKLQLSHPNSA